MSRHFWTPISLSLCLLAGLSTADPGVASGAAVAGRSVRASSPAAPAVNGEEITVTLPGGVPLVMVRIPAGTFTMGSPDSERGRGSDETQHQVTLTQDYYLGKTEVTQRQWVTMMGGNPSSGCGIDGLGDDHPVYCVSWDDICGGATGSSCAPTSFIGKVNTLLGTTNVRLPTEAEWERAARGGTTGTFSFNSIANPSWDLECGSFPQAEPYMWWCNNSGSSTRPVGTKQANPYGLHDMHGNAWEWVGDWYGSYMASPVADPPGSGSGSDRVIRGGNGKSGAHFCRAARRIHGYPGGRYDGFGFRLAMSLPSTSADGLVAYYPFDGDADDASGNNHNGTVSGAQPAQDRFGVAGRAYAFDGVDDMITIPDSPALTPTSTLTVAAWARPTSVFSRAQTVVGKGLDNTLGHYGLRLDCNWTPDGLPCTQIRTDAYPNPGGHPPLMSASPLGLGQWHHLASTWDGSTVNLYVDGQLDNQSAWVGNLAAGSGDLTVGAHAMASYRYWFAGDVDDVRIYDRALSATEIQELAEGGGATPGVLFESDGGSLSHFPCHWGSPAPTVSTTDGTPAPSIRFDTFGAYSTAAARFVLPHLLAGEVLHGSADLKFETGSDHIYLQFGAWLPAPCGYREDIMPVPQFYYNDSDSRLWVYAKRVSGTLEWTSTSLDLAAGVWHPVEFTMSPTANPGEYDFSIKIDGNTVVQDKSYHQLDANTELGLLIGDGGTGGSSHINYDNIKVEVIESTPSAPVATFNWSPPSPLAGQPIQFTDTSTNSPTSWSWSFGDGTPTSTEQNPVHTFTACGPSEVQLTACNSTGCDTNSQSVPIGGPPLALTIGDVRVGNSTRYASLFTVWFDVTDSGGGTVNPEGYLVHLLSPSAVLLGSRQPVTLDPDGKRWLVNLPIPEHDSPPGTFWLDGGVLKLVNTADCATAPIPLGSSELQVQGSAFDLGRHAFPFANGEWAKEDPFPQDVSRAAMVVGRQLWPLQAVEFYKAVGWGPLSRRKGSSIGLCYGLAASSIANFVHRGEPDYWGEHCEPIDSFCPWNGVTDNTWDTAIRERDQERQLGEPTKNAPFGVEDVFYSLNSTVDHASLEVLKKVMYYHVAQEAFVAAGAGSWVGQDAERPFSSDSFDLVGQYLRRGRPVLLAMQSSSGGGHEVVVVQAIRQGNSCSLLTYDNTLPWDPTRVDPDQHRPLTPYLRVALKSCSTASLADVSEHSVSIVDGRWAGDEFALAEGAILPWTTADSQWIYGSPRPTPTESRALLAPATSTAFTDDQRQELLDLGYSRVVLLGADRFAATLEGTTSPIAPVSGGVLDGTQAVFTSVPGGYLTELYLPVPDTTRYRVEATKNVSSPVLLVFVDVPVGADAIAALGYEELEVSPSDPTKVAFWVGRGNSDLVLTRTAGNGQTDTVVPTFAEYPTLRVPPVTDLAARRVGGSVVLTWKNPSHPGFEQVTVLRTAAGPATSVSDGTVVYQGTAETATDPAPGTTTAYYTVFSMRDGGSAEASEWVALKLDAWCIGGTVTAQGGTPVGGTSIAITMPNGTPLQATTDAGGAYAVCSLPAGAYTVRATAAGFTFAGSPQEVTIVADSATASFVGQPVISLRVASPIGGEQWPTGSTQYLGWTSTGSVTGVTVELSYDNGESWTTLATGAPGNGALSWTVASPISPHCLVRVTDPLSGQTAVSGGVFSVVASTTRGDANGDASTNVADVFYLINNLFAGGPAPLGPCDVNADSTVDVQDVFYLINFLFAGGPAPV